MVLLREDVPFDEVAKFFNLPIVAASEELGVSASGLKKICQENGIPRWPYRKVMAGARIEDIIQRARGQNPRLSADRHGQKGHHHQQLKGGAGKMGVLHPAKAAHPTNRGEGFLGLPPLPCSPFTPFTTAPYPMAPAGYQPPVRRTLGEGVAADSRGGEGEALRSEVLHRWWGGGAAGEGGETASGAQPGVEDEERGEPEGSAAADGGEDSRTAGGPVRSSLQLVRLRQRQSERARDALHYPYARGYMRVGEVEGDAAGVLRFVFGDFLPDAWGSGISMAEGS